MAEDLNSVRINLCNALCLLNISKGYCAHEGDINLLTAFEIAYKYVGDAEEKISLIYEL